VIFAVAEEMFDYSFSVILKPSKRCFNVQDLYCNHCNFNCAIGKELCGIRLLLNAKKHNGKLKKLIFTNNRHMCFPATSCENKK